MRELLDLDEESANETDPGAITWERPRLRDNKSALARLKEGLIAFEKAKSVGAREGSGLRYFSTITLFLTKTIIIIIDVTQRYVHKCGFSTFNRTVLYTRREFY